MICPYFSNGSGSFTIKAIYKTGDLCNAEGFIVIDWISYFELPYRHDPGYVDIGAGKRSIEIAELRGIGLGSFFMSLIIEWSKNLPELPVEPIMLSMDDARTDEAKESRNRFWRKLGFELFLDDKETHGTSRPMRSNQLIQPEAKLTKGWKIEELD